MYYKRHQCLTFDDDLATTRRDKEELQKVVTRLENVTRSVGLEVNENKTKYMT